MIILTIILTISIILNLLQFGLSYVDNKQIKTLYSLIRKNRYGEDLDTDESCELIKTIGNDESMSFQIFKKKMKKQINKF